MSKRVTINLQASLRDLREQLEMTQMQLAIHLDTSRSYVSAIECGGRPFTTKFRKRVCELLEEKKAKDAVPRFGRPKNWQDDHIYPRADNERIEEDLQKMETRLLAYMDRQFARIHTRLNDLEALVHPLPDDPDDGSSHPH